MDAEAILASTYTLLSQNGLQLTREQTILIHNALSQQKFDLFSKMFDLDLTKQFYALKLTNDNVLFHQTQPLYTTDNYPVSDSCTNAIFVQKTSIQDVVQDLIHAGQIQSLVQSNDGVCCHFFEPLSAKIFTLAFSEIYTIQFVNLNQKPMAPQEHQITRSNVFLEIQINRTSQVPFLDSIRGMLEISQLLNVYSDARDHGVVNFAQLADSISFLKSETVTQKRVTCTRMKTQEFVNKFPTIKKIWSFQ
ncbi:hypothetical protein SS50377_20569 [Spironucleus salmonicida]|uniref:Uncharacterized protein n=1 Tax=Spironucleus salmonicida TaxID=348837 RepID=V6LVC4_9EUKA|nr:hypothetical protein SS50377_20569 [Spironucleus salmonicida]|eukprot:EST48173.1 Hypothetical protein SS50377_11691 [Spironucleus salmonicida]